MSRARDGRVFEPTLTALFRVSDGGRVEVTSPAVGLWRRPPVIGELVIPGSELGEIEILGRLHRLQAPDRLRGVVVQVEADRARRPVGHGDLLMILDTESRVGPSELAAGAEADDAIHDAVGGLVFRSPSSGRFYSRPSPDKPSFVSVGDEISTGHTICLLEVMKTFNRVAYGGGGLPERARVVAVHPDNETDLDAGDLILSLEPIEE